MRFLSGQRVSLASLLGVACLLAVPSAVAQGNESSGEAGCLSDHEHSQVLRMDGKLLEARAALRRCSASACPGIVRSDCTEWLAEVTQQVPSIVLSVTSDKGEEKHVRVTLDDQPLTDTIDGKAVELDPGAHDLKFDLEGWPTQTVHVVIRESERNRIIEARFEKEKPPSPASPATLPAGPAEPTGPRPVPVVTYVFGVLALGAAGTGTYLGITTRQKFDQAKSDCGPNCPSSRADPIRLRAILADSSFGVALISAGLATYFYVTRPVVADNNPKHDKGAKDAAFSPSFDLGFTPTSASFQLRGEF